MLRIEAYAHNNNAVYFVGIAIEHIYYTWTKHFVCRTRTYSISATAHAGPKFLYSANSFHCSVLRHLSRAQSLQTSFSWLRKHIFFTFFPSFLYSFGSTLEYSFRDWFFYHLSEYLFFFHPPYSCHFNPLIIPGPPGTKKTISSLIAIILHGIVQFVILDSRRTA